MREISYGNINAIASHNATLLMQNWVMIAAIASILGFIVISTLTKGKK